MGFLTAALRKKMFGASNHRLCSVDGYIKIFERDRAEVELPLNGLVKLKWNPRKQSVSYSMSATIDSTKKVSREFEGVTSEMIVDFTKELKGRYPELQIMNAIDVL